MSRIEELLQAIINGDEANIKPRSRAEEYLVACACKECDNLPTPKSRLDALYYQLAQTISEGGSGGGEPVTVKMQGGWQGTAVPNSGTVDKLYFNTALSVEEVVALCEQLTFVPVDEYISVYGIGGSIENQVDLEIVKANYPDGVAYFIYSNMILNPSGMVPYFSSMSEPSTGLQAGWQGVSELTLGFEVVSTFDGLPVGAQNDLLSSLVSTTPFVHSEGSSKTLRGEYDGTPVIEKKAGVLDVKALLNQKKLPLSINFQPLTETITITENGTYTPSGVIDGQFKETYDMTVFDSLFPDSGVGEDITLIDTLYDNIPDSEKIQLILNKATNESNFSSINLLALGYGIVTYYGTRQAIESNGWLAGTNAPLGWYQFSTDGSGWAQISAPYLGEVPLNLFPNSIVAQALFSGEITPAAGFNPVVVDIPPEKVIAKLGTTSQGDYIGKPVPNSGSINTVYFYPIGYLSAEEIISVLNQLTFTEVNGELVYYVAIADSVSASGWLGVKVVKTATGYQIYQITNENTSSLCYDTDNTTVVRGNQVDIYNSVTNTYNGVSVGMQNDLITQVFMVDIQEQTSITLQGEYSGKPMNITENGTVYVPDLVAEKKLPLQYRINVPVPDGYIQPSGNIELKSNGTHNVKDYETATVNVPMPSGDTLKAVLDATKSSYYLFSGYTGTRVDSIISYNTTENVTNISYMFYNCSNLTEVPLLNTSNATNMDRMFCGCKKLTTVPLLNTSKVTNMDYTFYECKKLTTVPQFDTSNVEAFDKTFYNCESLTEVPLFDTSKANKLYYAFSSCYGLKSIPLFDTSNATDLSGFISSCSEIEEVPFFNLSKATTLRYTFSGLKKITSIPHFDTSNATNMDRFLSSCESLTEVPLFDTSKVTSMEGILHGTAIEEVPLFDTSNVKTLYWAFGRCPNLKRIPALNMRQCTNYADWLYESNNVTEIWIRNIQPISVPLYNNVLSKENLIHLVKELFINNGWSTYTLGMGSANLEKLSDVYVKLITPTAEQLAEDPELNNKKPFEVCESTDEGAMLITEYATLKKWKLS